MRIGVECGGTFTDLVMLDETGTLIASAKVFSTPDDPSRAVLAALDQVPSASYDNRATPLLHGSTVATNAVLERKGPRVGLLVTAGFRDVLLLGRHDRDRTFDLHYRKPKSLVRRVDILEISERMGFTGNVIKDLDEESVRRGITELLEQGVEAFAVSLLHSYANADHEQRVRRIVEDVAPGMPVSLSSEVSAEFREYERTSSTVVDAFLRPTIARYLEHLSREAAARGVSDLSMMQSNGGVVPLELVQARPIQVLLSGPAAGVAGAVASAGVAGHDNVITLDMGGTSTDVCLVTAGQPQRTSETFIDRMPIRLPMVDIATVGAGGGSVVALDSGGMLRVGPTSMGADPGPACYGRGGSEPTVTDANVARRLIRPGHFAAGGLHIDDVAAGKALEPTARSLGRSTEQLGEDIYQLANVTMAGAIRLVSIERGVDPRDYTLVAYGGAGPLHAAAVAEQMRMTRVLILAFAGIQSAYGLLAADFRHEIAVTDVSDLRALTPDEFAIKLDRLRRRAELDVQHLGQEPASMEVEFAVDMRYSGQGFELTVPIRDVPTVSADLSWLADLFHELHSQRYGHADATKPVQTVTYRLTLTRPQGLRQSPQTAAQGPLISSVEHILIDGQHIACQFLWRDSLSVGYTCDGPAIVEEPTTTTYVPPGWTLRVDDNTNLLLTRGD